ncbi:hypothetical protein SPBR_07555 [Sporothrix brasiliensis 5110]|uniref:Duf1711 domain containing protein n=1 Tax=Sporothrix brasiliensis 5110 TaxID=1398154 RepID=A0A0C2EQD1_9PEZI|nr:uncharacterized protein SPBR_07555 [Sporothrix brasiliensis 5110]KIH88549.1 hypothetical protein SPBR_07555 [Sporothrix brasiliensis 5110]
MSSKDRRKSEKLDKNAPGIITLTVSPDKLRAIFPDSHESTVSDTHTPAPSTPLPAKDEDNAENAKLAAAAKDDNASESTPATPTGAAADTPVSSSTMGPPNGAAAAAADEESNSNAASKKRGSLKRTAAAAGVDGTASAGPASTNGDTPQPAARVRSKPGPKKKAKLEDGVEIRASAAGAHKLGPKASMGAINAGLRALDRSGKPCRKWAKGSFQLKSFTGVHWSIPRWRAPPKTSATDTDGGDESTSATASADGTGSNKENGKDSNSDKKDQNAGAKTNGHVHGVTNGDATAPPSDVDMANTSAVPSPSVEPATEAATPVAAAA